jgi:hypothetical protein
MPPPSPSCWLVQLLWPRRRPCPDRADAIICLGAGMAEDTGPPARRGDTRARADLCGALGAALRPSWSSPARATTPTRPQRRWPSRAGGRHADGGLSSSNRAPIPRSRTRRFGLDLLPEPPERVIVVSDAFHLPRAWVIFAVLGHDARQPLRHRGRSRAGLRHAWLEPAGGRCDLVQRRAAAVYGVAGVMGIDRDTRIGWFN